MKTRTVNGLAILIAVLSSSAQTHAGINPSFQGLGDLPGGVYWSEANAISADGSTVVGRSRSGSGWEAFRWSNGVMMGLGDLPGDSFFSEAHGVSGDGSVIVGFGQSVAGRRAFRWEGGSMQNLGNLSAVGESKAWGVSNDGSVVVGHSSSAFGGIAIRWTGGVMSSLGDLPGGIHQSNATGVSGDGAVIVGWGYPEVYQEAFRWSEGEMKGLGLLAPLGSSQAFAVSADGNVVVGITDSASPLGSFAFRWQDGEMMSLGDLPGGTDVSYALAVSADGSVIVGQSGTGIGLEAVSATIWDEFHGLRSLRSVLTDDFGLNLDGWILERATGVSADGRTIVGQGRNPDGQIEGWIAHVPEPTTLTLLLVGVAMISRSASYSGRRR